LALHQRQAWPCLVPICDIDSPLISPEKERRNPSQAVAIATTTCNSRKELQRMTCCTAKYRLEAL